ncbi:MAG: 4Fe-4S binding protein [Granulosicoccus sp.]
MTTSQITYVSAGHCLIVGDVEQALVVAEQLPGIQCTVVSVHPALNTIDKQLIDDSGMAVFTVASLALSGYLGAYEAVAAAGSAELSLGVSIALDNGRFDLILDLSHKPLMRASLAPFGYFHTPDAVSLAAAVSELPNLVGEFEKPRYFAYNASICAHSRSQLPGCQRCLEVCVTGAIDSLGDGIKVDPFLCQGCGSCATVCPTGAMTYAYPNPADAIERTRQMLQKTETHPRVLLLHSENNQAVVDAANLPENFLALLVEEVSAFGIDYWTAMLTSGFSQIVLLSDAAADDLNRQALAGQQALLHQLLQGLGVDEPAVKLVDSTWLADREHLKVDSTALSALTAAPFVTHGDKRQTLRMALDVLSGQLKPEDSVVTLDKGAPFGRIHINQKACTLCMACVSTCPAKALLDGQDTPALRMIEANCVQCGLCETACPESAITLEARYVWDSVAARRIDTLHEETPFKCISCQKPFATDRMIETMLDKLGSHWMFSNRKALERLKMCEDCRVMAIFDDHPEGMDVHAKDKPTA